MKREMAETLIGTVVSAWTSWRGTYAGELVEIIPHRPFRARVKVACVLSLPDGERARIIADGEMLEVGGVNIRPFSEPLISWKESVSRLLKSEQFQYQDYKERKAVNQFTLDYMSRRLTNLQNQIEGVAA